MSLGPLMIDIAGTELSAEDEALLRHQLVGSIILFSRNYRDPVQATELVDSIHALKTPHLLVAVDQEGGRVQRFKNGFTALPALRALGRRYDQDRRAALDLAQEAGWLMASEVRSVGVDFSFAPCVDLDFGLSEIIGDRALHSDPTAVASLSVAYATGMREAGMAATAKHFPGHGAVVADSHIALPVDRRGLGDLQADLQPYRLLFENHLSAVMAAHVVFPEIDHLPASLSRRWITDILRGDLHFHGCVFADDLTMAGAAAFGDIARRTQLAIEAGCDVLPVCNDRSAVHTVLSALGPFTPDPASSARVVRMRARQPREVALKTSLRWQAAVARIASLSAPPPLTLTEDRS